MYDLTHFTLRDMTACEAALRRLGPGSSSMEEAANRIVRYFHESLVDGQSSTRACVLVRCFKTHPFEELPGDLRAFARGMLAGHPQSQGMKCLTLLASAGDQPGWNSRQASVGHRAIPLASELLVAQAPMISNLITQFGLEVETVLQPSPTLLLDLAQKTYNVFHVAEARGNPYVPVQEDFVIRFGIRSVLGFGGMLPTGDLFAVILFARVCIPRQTAEMFKTLALGAKVALLPFTGGTVFSGASGVAAEV